MNKLSPFYSTLCLAFIFFQSINAQRVISGTVSGSTGPLPGASVVVEGKAIGTTTDFDGNYTLDASEGDILVASFVGFATKKMNIGTSDQIDFFLEENQLLDEVVITALGITREKKSLGYAVTELAGQSVNNIKDHNLANSLAGKVPGLVVTQAGAVGSASRVTIRGNTSIRAGSNTQPLVVVDGVPINEFGINSGGNVYNSVITGGGISEVNPNDIESISVLKGGPAAALYGSRAGNGVILITTKKGSKGNKLGVTINSNITFDNPMFLPDFQNQFGQGTLGAAYTDLQDNFGGASWGAKLNGSQQLYYTGDQRSYSAQPNNVENFFTTGAKKILSLSLEKGFNDGSVLFSYTNNDTETLLPGAELDSHNFHLRSIVELSPQFSVDAKATFFTQNVVGRQSNGGEGIMSFVYNMPRNIVVSDLKQFQMANPGTPSEYKVLNYAGPNSNTGNPYWMLNHDVSEERKNRFYGYAKLHFEPYDWLAAFIRVGSDLSNAHSLSINKPGHHFYGTGRMSVGKYDAVELNTDFLVTATKDLTDDINLNVRVGGNLSKRTEESLAQGGESFKIPTKFFLSNLNTLFAIQQNPLGVKKIHSLYGAANLGYKDFLYVDLTTRNDWSSTLPEHNSSYLYSSGSVSAIVNRFIDPEQKIFNLLKLRGGWAEVGNDTGLYQIIQTFQVAGQGFLGLTTLSSPDVKFNSDLKSETVTSTEIGLEMSLFNNRLNIDFSAYNISTTDLIFDVPVPAATGYKFFRDNVGELTNKGIEVVIGGFPIQKENFSWNTSLFFSKNKNVLVSLIDGIDSFEFNRTNSGNLTVRAQVDGGVGDLYGSVWERDDQGNRLVNADGIPVNSSSDNYLGNANPDWLGGWSNRVAFGDFSLHFLIDGRFGGEFYSQTSADLDASGVSERSLLYRESGVTLDAINTGTDSKNDKSITGQQYWGAMSGIAENYIFDQTNIRLRELAIGYNIPNIQQVGIQSASIQLIGRNLFFLMKEAEDVDPEASIGTNLNAQGVNSSNLPTARSIGLNLTLNL